MDKMQNQVVTKVGVACNGLDVQRRIDSGQLQQVRRDRIGFIGIRSTHVVKQD
jgi:hypothetical protein